MYIECIVILFKGEICPAVQFVWGSDLNYFLCNYMLTNYYKT